MRYMIMPTKNVSVAQSIIGVASLIYDISKNGKYSIDEAFEKIKIEYYNKKKFNYDIDFNQYILGLCFLYSLRKININENGVIYCEVD